MLAGEEAAAQLGKSTAPCRRHGLQERGLGTEAWGGQHRRTGVSQEGRSARKTGLCRAGRHCRSEASRPRRSFVPHSMNIPLQRADEESCVFLELTALWGNRC